MSRRRRNGCRITAGLDSHNYKDKKNKNKNKKGKNMLGNFIGKFVPKQITKPVDGSEPTTLNIVLFNQKFLNDIAVQCVPVAGGSEFQVHYRALQVVISKEGFGRLVYTFPTVFFNFKQTVSTGSVDYNLVEVDQISKKLQPKSMEIANTIAAAFPKAFFENNGYSVEFREDEIGSIHRHPGDFSFSSIDLDNNPEHPGVIYRRGNAKDLIQTDSVMYLTGAGNNQHVKLVTTQTRVVDAKVLDDNKGIEGSYKRSKTVAMILKNTNTIETIVKTSTIPFDKFFESSDNAADVQKEISETMREFLCRFDQIKEDEIQETLENTSKIFKLVSMKYTPANEVDEKLIKSYGYGLGYQHYGAQTSYGYYNTETHTWEYDDDEKMERTIFELKDVLDYLDIKLHENTSLTGEQIREIYWNVENSKPIEFKLKGLDCKISEVSSSSQLLKIDLTGSTTWQSKGIYENNTLADELKEKGYVPISGPEDEKEETIDNLLGFDNAEETPDNNGIVIVDSENSSSFADEEKTHDNITVGDAITKWIVDPGQTKDIFKKAYPNHTWDNNGLSQVYHADGFKEIALMLPENTGIMFAPPSQVNTVAKIHPIEESDMRARITFANDAVDFSKDLDLYR